MKLVTESEEGENEMEASAHTRRQLPVSRG